MPSCITRTNNHKILKLKPIHIIRIISILPLKLTHISSNLQIKLSLSFQLIRIIKLYSTSFLHKILLASSFESVVDFKSQTKQKN